MKRFTITLASLSLAILPFAGAHAATVSPGDLIKASGPTVYYYHPDGIRLVFPNEKTYFTWYDNFSGVKTITNGELADIPIGGNITYRPGVQLVKVVTDPKVYAVGDGNKLRWIQTKAIAEQVYGADWATRVHDIPDAFFVDYRIGDPIDSAGDYSPNEQLNAYHTIADTWEAPAAVVAESIDTIVGESFTISMDSNPTTGYSWTVQYDESYLALTNATYTASEPSLLGSGGQEHFTFEALKVGSAIISCSYQRPWEADPIERRIYEVTIAPTPEPDFSFTITPSKTEAQKNEQIFLIAETDYEDGIERIDISVDETIYKTCESVNICSVTWQLPLTGLNDSYLYTAKLYAKDGEVYETTAKTTIVPWQYHESAILTIERPFIKPTQTASIIARAGEGLNASKISIFIDGVEEKICRLDPNECRYSDYIQGEIGSEHSVYAWIVTPGTQEYRTETKTITIAENDPPRITVVTEWEEISPTETVELTATADDDDGIAYVEIRQGGEMLQRCIGAAPCTVDAGPFDLPSGSVVSFDAVASDLLGLVTTSTAAASVTIK